MEPVVGVIFELGRVILKPAVNLFYPSQYAEGVLTLCATEDQEPREAENERKANPRAPLFILGNDKREN